MPAASSWRDLPDSPPSRAVPPRDTPAPVLERPAAPTPPAVSPAERPRRDAPWWRLGVAGLLIGVVGGVAWLISDRAASGTGAAPSVPAPVDTLPSPDREPAVPEGVAPGRVDESVPNRPEREFFFRSEGLPPEIQEFLERVPGPFGEGELPRHFEEFFGGDPAPFGEGFGFEGALPADLRELFERIPDLVLGDEAARREVEELIDRLLDDPDLPADVRRMMERLAEAFGG